MQTPMSQLIHDKYAEMIFLTEKTFCCYKDFLMLIPLNGEDIVIDLMDFTVLSINKKHIDFMRPIIRSIQVNNLSSSKDMKTHAEFKSLKYYLNNISSASFQKRESPDFILSNDNKQINLEITSAITQVAAQVNKVVAKKFGMGKSPDEIKTYIDNHHANLDKQYTLSDYEGKTVISPHRGLFGCNAYKDLICERAIVKSTKCMFYNEMADENIILIDTEGNLCFSTETDAEELANRFMSCKKKLLPVDRIIIINRTYKSHMIYNVMPGNFIFTRL